MKNNKDFTFSLTQDIKSTIGQQLAITPQLQQAISMLQMSTIELQDFTKAQVESNPLLTASEEEIEPYQHTRSFFNKPDQNFDNNELIYNVRNSLSLTDHLTQQLFIAFTDSWSRNIGLFIIRPSAEAVNSV